VLIVPRCALGEQRGAGSFSRMAWAFWLAVPIVATVVAAVATGWSARRSRPARRADPVDAMQAHRNYLDALTVPARGTERVAPPVLGDLRD
jgi:hypothetical protein